MWEQPFYRMRKGRKTVRVEVTLSAPRFLDHVSVLPDALAFLKDEKIDSVLDFGAGKLRNAMYLLKQGYKVHAVEYERQFTQYPVSKTQLATAKAYANFKQLIFPDQFIACKERFDLALLSNVVTIIPSARHRHLILKYCREKVRRSGFLLWISQRGDTHYKDRLVNKIGDGFLIGAHRERATFYREFTAGEVDHLMQKAGFTLVKPLPFFKNQARVYQRR